MNRRFRASYRIAIGFAICALLAIYGYRYANDILLSGHFPPLVPGKVNILGLDTSQGYGILIENRAAKLVFASEGSFGPGKMDEKDLENSSGDRKFIPIKEMLAGLAGNVASLGYFVERLNTITDDDQYPDAPVWTIEEIDKALQGDKGLRDKLVRDLNINLDGSPIDRISKRSFQNGILVDVPVKINIPVGQSRKTIAARVKRDYKPDLLKTVESSLNGKFYDDKVLASEYAAEAARVQARQIPKEDVAASLREFAKDAGRLAEAPQRVLDSITVVINENQITGSSYSTQTTSRGTAYTLYIHLNDEGKRRLWQFSRDHVGNQLLVTVNGVAIAAPFVEEGIASGEVEVTRLEDQALVEDAVNTMDPKRDTHN